MPFRGRIIFRQYLKQKRLRYGLEFSNYAVVQDTLILLKYAREKKKIEIKEQETYRPTL